MENVCINVTSSKDGNKAEKSEKRKHFIHYFDFIVFQHRQTAVTNGLKYPTTFISSKGI